jgi:hypothetical protein
VFRVYVSNVRMPRSHSITFGLPAATMYSACHEALLDRCPEPALQHHRAGYPPRGIQQRVVLHVAGADLRMSAYSATMSTWFGSITSVITGARCDRALPPGTECLDPESLERVGTGRGLKAPPRQDRRARGLHCIGRLQKLLPALHGARSGHHRLSDPSPITASSTRSPCPRMELPRGELERPADRGHRLDPWERGQDGWRAPVSSADIADNCDDYTLRAGWSYGDMPSPGSGS